MVYILGFHRLISNINKLIAVFLSILFLALLFSMGYEVFSRYVLMSSTSWVYEASKMTFGFVAIWGGGYTLLKGDHINIDLFYDKWEGLFKRNIKHVNFLFFVFYISFLIYLSFYDSLNSFNLKETANSTLSQPLYHWRISLVVGLVMLFFQGVAEYLMSIFDLESKYAFKY